MANIIISPNKYIQGNGELKNISSYISPLGKKALILISKSGFKRIGDILKSSFETSDCEVIFEIFNGECSKNEVNRIKSILESNSCDVIVGIGGGKILDTAKAASFYSNCKVAIVPTIASTDAPCSALSVLYTDEGIFDEYLFLPNNPNLVLLDTEIISNAPSRLLVAGMGDALATYFEARACRLSHASTCAGGTQSLAAMGLAKLCYDTLLLDGLKAKLAIENKVCTKSVENIIEANTLLSGIGFESGGLAAAHAIHNGFTVLEECHHLYHGEKVAFGTLVQLVLENSPLEEIEEVLFFCKEVGLPTTLEQLGIKDKSHENLMKVSLASTAPNETIHNMPFKVTAESVYSAILSADSLGNLYN